MGKLPHNFQPWSDDNDNTLAGTPFAKPPHHNKRGHLDYEKFSMQQPPIPPTQQMFGRQQGSNLQPSDYEFSVITKTRIEIATLKR